MRGCLLIVQDEITVLINTHEIIHIMSILLLGGVYSGLLSLVKPKTESSSLNKVLLNLCFIF